MDINHILQTVPAVNPSLTVFLHPDQTKVFGGGKKHGILKAVQHVRQKKLNRNTGNAMKGNSFISPFTFANYLKNRLKLQK